VKVKFEKATVAKVVLTASLIAQMVALAGVLLGFFRIDDPMQALTWSCVNSLIWTWVAYDFAQEKLKLESRKPV